jgi:hypothetical protein
MGPRKWFGELAPLGGGPRTAVVTAETEICCLGLARWEFRALRIAAVWTTCVNSQADVNEPPGEDRGESLVGVESPYVICPDVEDTSGCHLVGLY